MNRTITIKGVGRLSLKPDQVAVTLCLKTTDPVYEEAMRAATAELAQLRAAIAGVTLGTLLSIDYNWGELHLYSPTSCSVGSADLAVTCGAPADMAIEPDDIDVSDSAVFVWEIR